MLALGIDPGTAICGYGLVDMQGSRLKAVEYGAILTSPKMRPQDTERHRTGGTHTAPNKTVRSRLRQSFQRADYLYGDEDTASARAAQTGRRRRRARRCHLHHALHEQPNLAQ